MPPDFRYEQFCPLARAAELLGERWTLPIVRELFVGPQRFTDLRRRLPGLSSSVLAARLDRLGRAGVIAQRELPPPAASLVYELTETGHALQPAIKELIRWGVRLLGLPRAGDHFEPDWPLVAMDLFARRDASPPRRFALRLTAGEGGSVEAWVSGGPDGTRVARRAPDGGVDLRVAAPAMLFLALVGGALPARAARVHPDVTLEGDADALDDLPRLFELAGSAEPARPDASTLPARPSQP
jgi:DNA-binding HxlR family transcriptional regulator